jgi:hypothetical protein
MSFKDFEKRCIALMEKRGISGHIAAKRFIQEFKMALCYFQEMGYGDVETTLSLLEDDKNLTPNTILLTNFKTRLSKLVSDPLKKDGIFMHLFNWLLGSKGKGVGAGELALPLIISNYKFSNESDGIYFVDGIKKKQEMKKNGASVKPIKTGVTEKGLVDELNKLYFQGTVPGMKDKKKFEVHLKTVTDPKVYREYFEKLYPRCDIDKLASEVEICYTDSTEFNTAVGKFALKQYQKVDGWTNIMFIDQGKEDGTKKERDRAVDPLIVNIADVTDIDFLGLTFVPKLARKKDTQAIADGYVNVQF